MGKSTRLWKTNGVQDKFLEKLILSRKVDKNTTPSSLKKEYPQIFNDFSTPVIRNHLLVLKRKNGMYLDDADDQSADADEKENVDEKEHLDESLDFLSNKSNIPLQSDSNYIQHSIYPCICEKYMDPDTEIDRVYVSLNLPGGAECAQLSLNNNGTHAVVTYNWPKAMYTMDEQFKTDATVEQKFHPKVIAVKKGLQKVRANIDAAPKGTITIKLPIKVQTHTSSWTKRGISKIDGSQMIIGDFQGITKDYNIKLESSIVKFDKI